MCWVLLVFIMDVDGDYGKLTEAGPCGTFYIGTFWKLPYQTAQLYLKYLHCLCYVCFGLMHDLLLFLGGESQSVIINMKPVKSSGISVGFMGYYKIGFGCYDISW